MKNMFFLLGICCLFLSCNDHRSDVVASVPVRYFLAGVYVAFDNGEFCAAWDTLVIRRDNHRDNGYVITRNTTFQRFQGVYQFPNESASIQWSAVYVESAHTAFSTGEDDEILVMLGQDRLRLGEVTYYRIE